MQRLKVLMITGLLLFLSLTVVGRVEASSIGVMPIPFLSLAATPIASSDQELMTQLETEILPQLETIFTPKQQEQFKTNIADGISFRKAFKSLMLTPEQKNQLKALLKVIPQKDAFASLTPDQKRQLFLKKKEMFMPTSEEITEKINASMEGKGMTLPEGVREKIEAGLKKKEEFMPTIGDIMAKIEAATEAIKSKLTE